MIFKSPGVYTQEKDVSGYYVNKNQLRRVNIIKIFNMNIVRDIYASKKLFHGPGQIHMVKKSNYGSNHSFKLR